MDAVFTTSPALGAGENPTRYCTPGYSGTQPRVDPVPPHTTFAVTATEGGTWVPWDEWHKLRVPDYKGKRVHSILFADGRVWDAFSGFRPQSANYSADMRANVVRVWEEYQTAKNRIDTMRLEPEIFGEV